ncbi:GNAT family N-acetyltransferase [Streptomyces sp. WM6378]|uniref:GNAT family N-acetyltransferase n=1 Tax=Streptomyces sp. WM6378 TaxID=1415557 RepID=UPI0006ADE568|nr:GNAT family N-acetyltransferase [Streptomyces sp. WM6378]KOU34918.1 acetyltransferase [Streptomyces sp. WM6378]
MGVRIRRAGQSDAAAVVRVLDAAFMYDPVSSWVLPDEARRREVHHRLMEAFFQLSFAEGHVDITEDGSAVALWIDVPAEPRETGDGDEGPAQLRAFVDPDNERVEQIAHLMAGIHPHGRAHAYLWMIGVTPDRQGEGLGAELITSVLERCDREGLPAYLEASSERSPHLYRRLGFAPLGEPVRLPDGPLVHPMWREPKG